MKKIKIKPLIIALLVPVSVGLVSAFITSAKMDAFEAVNKPSFSPPSILFPIVWTVLYILMGVSSYLVLTSPSSQKKIDKALLAYGISLVLNFFWSIIFFNLEAFSFAFLWLCILLAVVIYTLVLYFKINRIAAYLQIPYVLWLIFAGVLNISIAAMN